MDEYVQRRGSSGEAVGGCAHIRRVLERTVGKFTGGEAGPGSWEARTVGNAIKLLQDGGTHVKGKGQTDKLKDRLTRVHWACLAFLCWVKVSLSQDDLGELTVTPMGTRYGGSYLQSRTWEAEAGGLL